MAEVVLITGAGRGIGAAAALAAARAGPCGRRQLPRRCAGGGARGRAHPRRGGRAVAVQADVADPAEVARLFDEVTAALGPVTALVNNAGTTGRHHALRRPRPRDAAPGDRRQPDRLHAVQPGGGAPLGARGGRAARSSTSPRSRRSTGSPGEYVHYAATKAAVEAFTRGLAREVAGEGIRVNAVAPGTVQTGIHAAGGDPERPARVAPRIPLGRVGAPEEIAAAILWLLSPAASYATGSVLTVAGGL